MKKILLFGAGKSATCLIDHLIKEVTVRNWRLTVADGNLALVQSKTGRHDRVNAVEVYIEAEKERKSLVKDADIVISLLPPSLHYFVALDCIEFGKNLLTASYVDEKIKKLETEIKKKQLLFICEMGLDPGIDHMSAMELINRVKSEGGQIWSFKSHTGGLTAPESDDNPWHYKISWNPRNVVTAGSAGALYIEEGRQKEKTYQELFNHCSEVKLPKMEPLAWYPNRDSLSYMPVYGLEDCTTFIRTTLRYPVFCQYWKSIVHAGLTNDTEIVETPDLTYKKWASAIDPFIGEDNKVAFEFLGLFDETLVPAAAKTSADILQSLVETRLAMRPEDKDMIVMLHELEYKHQEVNHSIKSSLVVKGTDNVKTAMAKTVGLPLGIAAILILEGKISLTGLHIPILPEIYKPVLKQLEAHGVKFEETVS